MFWHCFVLSKAAGILRVSVLALAILPPGRARMVTTNAETLLLLSGLQCTPLQGECEWQDTRRKVAGSRSSFFALTWATQDADG